MKVLWKTQHMPICVIFAVVFLFSINHPSNAHIWRRQSANGPGTTKNISDIFLGRCYEYLQCLQADQCGRRPNKIDCVTVRDEFLSVFRYQEPCNTPADAYDGVLNMTMPITPKDQTLFWSGLLNAALNVARVSMLYRILEESLPGYLANNLIWCGDPNSPDGINYDECPSSYDCEGETSFRFWRAASREFARQAAGMVSVALNAHREGGAFRNTSVFATVELPNLDPEKVTMVEILLVPDIKKPANESEQCGKGSILVLQNLLDEAGMKWKCTYDPLEFRFIQCTTLENPLDYAACRGDSSGDDKRLAIIIGAVLGSVVVILLVILVAIVITKFCGSRCGVPSNMADGTEFLTDVVPKGHGKL